MDTARADIASSRLAAEAIAGAAVKLPLAVVMAEGRLLHAADREHAAAVIRFIATLQPSVLDQRNPVTLTLLHPIPAHRVAQLAQQFHIAVLVDMRAAVAVANRMAAADMPTVEVDAGNL
jgi:hypothetical protein